MVLAQQGEAAETIEPGQHQIEQDEVGPGARDERFHLETGGSGTHYREAVGLLQGLPERAQHQRVILDNYDSRLHELQRYAEDVKNPMIYREMTRSCQLAHTHVSRRKHVLCAIWNFSLFCSVSAC